MLGKKKKEKEKTKKKKNTKYKKYIYCTDYCHQINLIRLDTSDGEHPG
jgi:hypothetical protein